MARKILGRVLREPAQAPEDPYFRLLAAVVRRAKKDAQVEKYRQEATKFVKQLQSEYSG